MRIEVDGRKYEVEGGKLLDVLLDLGFEIPHACYYPAVGSYGACRLCLVEVEIGGSWRIVASCSIEVEDGMKVRTGSKRLDDVRAMVMEMLGEDVSGRCILCGLCVNVCKIVGVEAISFVGRSTERRVSTPFDVPTDRCILCLSCVNLCPTGAIRYENGRLMLEDRIVSDQNLLRCEICGRSFISSEYVRRLGLEKVICDECRRRSSALRYRRAIRF